MPVKVTRKPRKQRPVNSVPPQPAPPAKRLNGTKAPLPPPPRSPGIALRQEVSHGPLPPPPQFLMERKEQHQGFVENEYSYISEMPPRPSSAAPPVAMPPYTDAAHGTVIVNEMVTKKTDWSDSEPDYTSPPTPYTSPRHTHYDVNSLRSSEDNLASDSEIPVPYFFKNNYPCSAPQDQGNFSMKIYSKSPSDELPPPFYEDEPEMMVPYDPQNGQIQNQFCGSLQSRYWRNKYTGACIPNFHASRASLQSKSGGSTM